MARTGDLRGLAAPGGQDRRGEPGLLNGVGVDTPVIGPRCPRLDRAGRGEDLAGLVRAVAHHQPASVGVALAGEPGDVVVDLRRQGLGEHPAGTLADELVDQRRTIRSAGIIRVASSRNYGEHGPYLPDSVAAPVLLESLKITGRVRPDVVIHRFQHCSVSRRRMPPRLTDTDWHPARFQQLIGLGQRQVTEAAHQ
jgi:hypothetical protein